LEHPTATSLLSLARISKFCLLYNHETSNPVGDNYVNIISPMKRATRLSPENQVTLGGYCGGHPPPKWSHFRAKMKQLTRAKFSFYFGLEANIRTGRRQPSGRSARAGDSLRLHEDTALLPHLQPSRPPAKIELP
jgi:hypothetical protein